MLAVAAAIAVLLTGCSSADDWSRPHPKPSPVGTLGRGFINPAAPPAPESTVRPRPGSWDGVHPSKGYRVVLLTAGNDRQTKTLVAAVTGWAENEHVSLKTVTATKPDQFISRITKAIDLAPDLIISAGNDLVAGGVSTWFVTAPAAPHGSVPVAPISPGLYPISPGCPARGVKISTPFATPSPSESIVSAALIACVMFIPVPRSVASDCL